MLTTANDKHTLQSTNIIFVSTEPIAQKLLSERLFTIIFLYRKMRWQRMHIKPNGSFVEDRAAHQNTKPEEIK